MVTSIRIDIDNAKKAASNLKSLSNQVTNLTNQLNGPVQNLPSFWEGESSKRLYSDFEAWKKKMQSLASNLISIATEIEKIAKALELADKRLAI